MRLSRQPMALVTNERAEVVGLVTCDMVLAHILGADKGSTA
jgi:CBS domain containing-hemolysin-like protein